MTQPWKAQHRIDKKQAVELITTQFPDLAPVSVEFLGEGWDNTVFRVNHHFVFRFPRRIQGAHLVEAEWRALPHLAEFLPIAIPEPLFFGNPTTTYPWHFLGYKFVPGTSANACNLTTNDRIRLATPLAHFLKTLHSLPVDPTLDLATSEHAMEKMDIEKRYPAIYENVEKIHALKLSEHSEKILELLNAVKHVRNTGKHTWVHGDLSGEHILLDAQKQLCGIIDWGDVHIDTPASDLHIAFNFLPPEGREQFFKTYGPIDEQTRQLTIFRAIRQTSWVILFAHTEKKESTLTNALAEFAWIASAVI